MNNQLDEKIMNMLDDAEFMTIGTSVGGNSSASNVYFANDGFDIYFLLLIQLERQNRLELILVCSV